MSTKREIQELAAEYLLGKLQGDDRDSFEEVVFGDDEISNMLDAAEHDLIDEYLRGELAADQRGQFEKFFLASTTGRNKVASARLMHEHLIDRELRPRAAPTTSVSTTWSWLRMPSLAWAGAFGLITAAILIGGWLILGRSDNPQLADSGAPKPTPVPTIEQTNVSVPSNTPITPPKDERAAANIPKDDSTEKPPAPKVFAATLFPATRSGERPTLMVPKDAERVTLRIVHENAKEFRRYRVEIHDDSGRTLISREFPIRKTRISAPINFTFDIAVLKAGSYELALLGIGESDRSEEIKFYDFVVKKKYKTFLD
jgi:hypothetical protein